MFNLRLCNAATIRYFQLKFGHMHLCGMNFTYFSPHSCKCNSLGCTAAIICGNACHGPRSDSLYSGSERSQFNSPRLVKREAGFPNPRRALIGSNPLWRVNDSPYYRECVYIRIYWCACVYVYIHMPANACYYVYMIICMSFMCAHFMYADFMMFFFTYGCLARDDLIKKFKQTLPSPFGGGKM